jgi:hypothetical protein
LFPAPTAASIKVEHLDPLADPTNDLQPVTAGSKLNWKINWAYGFALNGAGTDAATWDGHSLSLITPATEADIPSKGKKLTILAELGGVGGKLYLRTFDANGQMILHSDETKATGQKLQQKMSALKANIAGLFPPHSLTATERDQTLAAVRDLMGGSTSTSLNLRKFVDHAYLIDLTNPDDVVPVADPVVVGKPTDPDANITDPRVQSPDADAYESAVRGAFAEVSAPFFKFDEQSDYDSKLKRAFAKDTTIYHKSGSTKKLSQQEQDEVDDSRRAIQLRGTILHKMLRDVQQYAALDGAADPNNTMLDLRKNSLAFRFGMVFRVSGPEAVQGADPGVRWLEATPGNVQQRSSVSSTAVDSGDIPVFHFNKRDDSFANAPPAFSKVRKFEHAEMICVAWELQPSGVMTPDGLEHQLSHYHVSRVHLNGTDPEATFEVKKGEVLHNDEGVPLRLQPRFQLVDKFDNSGTGIAALTEEGKVYLYTITPVDLSGSVSPRPLSIVATRLPADPPLVPGDGELVLNYLLPDAESAWQNIGTDRPMVRIPDTIRFQWSDPLPAPGTSPPAVESYRLIFRRENALPIGFFGADADTRGGRTAGFPVTNARTLRTDRVIEIFRKNITPGGVIDPETGEKLRADSGRLIQSVELKLQDLKDKGVLPLDGFWHPDAWRVFVQAVSPRRGPAGSQVEGVPSALAAVTISFHFEGNPAPAKVAYEERRLGILEWVPDPLRFELLPPEDQTVRSGFAQIPMPSLEDPSSWIYSPTASTNGTLQGLRFEAHPERFRALRMTWNQGPSARNTRPIELHAKYQVFEFDADAKTAETLDIPDGTTMDVAVWGQQAGLRLVQEVELMPPDDLALNPADAANPVAWDVWTPATSRRILLRRAMIANRTWPEKTDPTQLGPWFSWRDSYLDWPPPSNPPKVDPSNRRNWPFHALLRAAFERLVSLPDGPPPAGSAWPLGKYSFEISRTTRADQKKSDPSKPAPPLGGGTPVNPYPDPNNPQPKTKSANTPKPPSPLGAFLAANAPGSDPHGWSILDRMGLAVGFRVRLRKTGTYVIGADLTALVQFLISGLKATLVNANLPDKSTHKPGDPITLNVAAVDDQVRYILLDGTADPTKSPVAVPKGTTVQVTTIVPPLGSPALLCWGTANVSDPSGTVTLDPGTTNPTAFDDASKYLFVESLFQPGARTDIGPDDHTAGDAVKATGLLALTRLSLRPRLKQRMRYQAVLVTGTPQNAALPTTQPGSPIRIEIKTTNSDAWYMIQSGTPGLPTSLPQGTTTIVPIMPKEGIIGILFQGVFDGTPTIATVKATDPSGQPQPTPLVVEANENFAPTDWRARYFAIPSAQDPNDNKAAPWAVNVVPDDEKKAWSNFGTHLARINPDLTLPQPSQDDMAPLLSWLDRFFQEGGDVSPIGDGDPNSAATKAAAAAPAATPDGPWVSSAYPRAATPIALTPDAAGRITYYRIIEDQWGHTFRFLLRPQGRYDRLWETLSHAPGVFNKARGTIALQQRQIPAPEPGGMDVVLDRIRPLAAPLVLSSRRLDPASPPGQSVPPGAIWEVIVAKHPEQALIEKNRALVNHLSFRQVAHTLVRSMADPQPLRELRITLASAVTGVIGNPRLLPLSYKVTVGVITKAFDLDTPTIDNLVTKINALGLPVKAARADVTGVAGEVRVVLTPTTPLPALTSDVQLLAPVNSTANLPTTGTDLLVLAEVSHILHFLAFDTHGQKFLDIDEKTFVTQTPQIAALRALIKPLMPPHTLSNQEKSTIIGSVTALAYHAPPLRLASVVKAIETVLTSEVLDLADPRFEIPINSQPPKGPRQIPPPDLPGPPAKLDHLDLDSIEGDDLRSIDLPLRPVDFDQGVMALQWRCLPFYYRHKLLLIAQTSAVVSPITALDQRDFEYITPMPAATMQGVPNVSGSGRRRKITIELARYWDCLSKDTQTHWPIEDPASVGNFDPNSVARRLSSLIDPAVIYQVIITHPSRNVQVVAEYLHDPTEVSGYQSRPLPAPFRGDAIRCLPPPDGPGVGSKLTFLETLLTRVADSSADDALVFESISGRAAFSGASAAGVTVIFPPAAPLTACALRITGTLTPAQVADVVALAGTSDPTFATPLLQLLAQPGPDAYAEACVGMEQLAELHPGSTIDAANKKITWPGEISADEQKVVQGWIATSQFSATLTNLLKTLDGQNVTLSYPADAANPVQADTTIPATRLAISPTGMTWFHRLTQPATAQEVTELNTLKGKAGLPAPVVAALSSLIADVSAPSTLATVVPIAETFWKQRPAQSTLPASLQGVLLVGHGAVGFRGLMTLAEGKALQGLAGLSEPDKAAVARLFDSSLGGGLDGGTLQIRARRGGAGVQFVKIAGDLSQSGP